ncbi:hypothetical protein LCGC14_1482400 [marine sediment metagenome]|uniref:Uncharacterized protein n=1 Tax=marine sediment metagenome TaxID=412755 RepID=A0A0F9J976_9ZZZZ
MSRLGVAYKRLIDLATLTAIPVDGDYYVVSDVSTANREKKIDAGRIQHIDLATGDLQTEGDLDVLGEVKNVSYESNTVYFEGNIVFNRD